MENKLQNHENRIQSQRHISEIQVKDQRNTVGNRDNGGYAQTRFGIERKPQGQDKQPGSIESRAVPNCQMRSVRRLRIPWISAKKNEKIDSFHKNAEIFCVIHHLTEHTGL